MYFIKQKLFHYREQINQIIFELELEFLLKRKVMCVKDIYLKRPIF